MFKNKKHTIVIASLLVAALAFGLMALVPNNIASAADFNETGIAHQGGPGGQNRGPRERDNTYLADALGITQDELQAAFEEARAAHEAGGETEKGENLAAALGITVDELEAAQEAAKDAAIAQALADGKITEEQVALKEAHEALRNYMEKDEMLAKALGISVDELTAAQEDGKRIPDLLDELGLDEETFRANMDAAREDALNQAVADGVITQEQADQIQENGLGGPDGKGGPGRGGRPGGGSFPGSKRPEGDDSGRPSRPGGQPPAGAGGNG